MILGPNPVSFNSNLIRIRSRIIAKYLVGFCKLSLVIEYNNWFPELKFHLMRNVKCEYIGSFRWIVPRQ